MKRSIIFLQSLLVLLVAIQATKACTCKVQALEFYWCASSTAVIKARVLSEAHIDTSGTLVADESMGVKKRYRLREETVYKSGPTTIRKVNGNFFEMRVQSDEGTCAVDFEQQTSYLLTGSVNKKGDFLTSSCYVNRPWANVTTDKNTMDLLEGRREANCSSID